MASAGQHTPKRIPRFVKQAAAQDQFLNAVRKLCPEVLYSLRDSVLPLYREVEVGDATHPHFPVSWLDWLTFEKADGTHNSQFLPPKAAILKWAEDYNLTKCSPGAQKAPAAHWVCKVAVKTLLTWLDSDLMLDPPPENPGDPVIPKWAPHHGPASYVLIAAAERKSHQFTFLGPHPTDDPDLDSYRNRMRSALDQALHAAWDEAQESLRARFGTELDHDRETEKHCRWLALYQVKGWSAHRIAESDYAPQSDVVSTVSRAVEKVCALIDLTLRPNRRGPQRRRN